MESKLTGVDCLWWHVAQIHRLKIGDTFYGSHGLIEGGHVHDEYEYEVVGILNPAPILDQLILTNTQSVWQVHHHEAIEQDREHHEEESAAAETNAKF